MTSRAPGRRRWVVRLDPERERRLYFLSALGMIGLWAASKLVSIFS